MAEFDANTAEFESNATACQLTRNKSLAVEYQGTRPHKPLKTSHRLQRRRGQKIPPITNSPTAATPDRPPPPQPPEPRPAASSAGTRE
jgi:hypothetical protein